MPTIPDPSHRDKTNSNGEAFPWSIAEQKAIAEQIRKDRDKRTRDAIRATERTEDNGEVPLEGCERSPGTPLTPFSQCSPSSPLHGERSPFSPLHTEAQQFPLDTVPDRSSRYERCLFDLARRLKAMP